MRRAPLAALMCIAGLVAGCGSGSSTTPTSGAGSGKGSSQPASAPAIASLAQSQDTMGPPPSGTRYDAVNHAFLERLATILGHALETRGLHNVNVTCSASVAARAKCQADGVTDGGQSATGTLMVRIDRATGELGFVST